MATFPEASVFIPDGRISRVRLAALACPRGAFPQQPKLKRWRASAPGWCGLLRGSTRSLREPGFTRFCARSGRGRKPAKCREPLCPVGVLPRRGGSPGSSRRALPLLPCSDRLMRQAKSLSSTSGFPSSDESLQVVASPCCEMALPDVISAILAWALGPPTPRCPSDALTRFFSEGFGLLPGERGSAHRFFPAHSFGRGTISGLQSFSDVRAPMLARPPGCSHRIHGLSIIRSSRALDRWRSLAWRQLGHAPSCRFSMNGRPGLVHHAELGWLPAPSSGIATCLIRATDMTGLSPAGLQPCRPLPPRESLIRQSAPGNQEVDR
jgi:hypothetical protein